MANSKAGSRRDAAVRQSISRRNKEEEKQENIKREGHHRPVTATAKKETKKDKLK